jgi:hypothetical protein
MTSGIQTRECQIIEVDCGFHGVFGLSNVLATEVDDARDES